MANLASSPFAFVLASADAIFPSPALPQHYISYFSLHLNLCSSCIFFSPFQCFSLCGKSRLIIGLSLLSFMRSNQKRCTKNKLCRGCRHILFSPFQCFSLCSKSRLFSSKNKFQPVIQIPTEVDCLHSHLVPSNPMCTSAFLEVTL